MPFKINPFSNRLDEISDLSTPPSDIPIDFLGNTGLGASAVLNVLNVVGSGILSVDASGDTLTISSSGGPAGTITGDVGGALSQTSGNWNIVAGANAGNSVSFDGSGSTLSLNFADGNDNIFFGRVSGTGSPGPANVGVGSGTFQNINGATQNTAVGFVALNAQTSGSNNTAVGYRCLAVGTAFGANTGVGSDCLLSCTGNYNVGIGWQTLQNLTSGSANTCIGNTTGYNYTGAETDNILINHAGVVGESKVIRIGTAGSSTSCFIAGITGVAIIAGAAVLCDANGQLGTVVSSVRYKENIEEVSGETSILSLRPVFFNYKTDEKKTKTYGFIAEEVEKSCPELCIYGEDGQIESVKYHEMPALLLKEIQRLNNRISRLEMLYGLEAI